MSVFNVFPFVQLLMVRIAMPIFAIREGDNMSNCWQHELFIHDLM